MSEITVNTRRIKLPFKASEEKPYIFASYGHNDKEKVFPIFKQLYEIGYNLWYDEGIEINTAYDNVIASHVKECSVFVLFVSRHSVTRPYVTENELGYAVRLGKTILPLFIEDEVELPPGVDMLLKGVRYNSTNEIIVKIKQLGIKCYGKRKAKETEREIPQGWMDEEDIDNNSTKKNLVSCVETPYAFIGIHPEERSVARAYIKELYNAGYNVRSYEYSEERERMHALASQNCGAFVPVLTKKYVESGMLETDVKMAQTVGKQIIGLIVKQRDEKGKEVNVCLPQNLSMVLGGKQMLNENERTREGFLTELEKALEKNNCCHFGKDGKVDRRTFMVPGFLYEFTEDNKGIILTKYNGSDTNVVINETYSYFPVVEIGAKAFEESTNLISVTIPKTVTCIGKFAFAKCCNLISILIPESVTNIGYGAFSKCSSLASITIPNNMTCIEGGWFEECTSLTSITIPESVTYIGSYSFSGCRNLTSVTIPGGVTCIDWGTFENCTSIFSMIIPNGVKRIDWFAFKGCSNLTSMIIPDSVKRIGMYAFEGCDKLTIFCKKGSKAWKYAKKHKIMCFKTGISIPYIFKLIFLLCLATVACVQLSGLVDILGWLKGLFG